MIGGNYDRKTRTQEGTGTIALWADNGRTKWQPLSHLSLLTSQTMSNRVIVHHSHQ